MDIRDTSTWLVHGTPSFEQNIIYHPKCHNFILIEITISARQFTSVENFDGDPEFETRSFEQLPAVYFCLEI